MAFRNVALPLLSGGVMLLGFAAFSWLRGKRPSKKDEPVIRGIEPPADEIPDVLELDLDFESELLSEREASLHDSVAPEDIGALFLARATDALSPFRDHSEHRYFDLDQLRFENGSVSEATVRASGGEESLDWDDDEEAAAESERRPANGTR